MNIYSLLEFVCRFHDNFFFLLFLRTSSSWSLVCWLWLWCGILSPVSLRDCVPTLLSSFIRLQTSNRSFDEVSVRYTNTGKRRTSNGKKFTYPPIFAFPFIKIYGNASKYALLPFNQKSEIRRGELNADGKSQDRKYFSFGFASSAVIRNAFPTMKTQARIEWELVVAKRNGAQSHHTLSLSRYDIWQSIELCVQNVIFCRVLRIY